MKRNASRFLSRTTQQCIGRICNDGNSSSSRMLFVRSLGYTTNITLARYIYHESSQRQQSKNHNHGHRASSSSNGSDSNSNNTAGILELTESEFHNLADETLDEIVDWLTVLEESEELDADIVLSQGVLNIVLQNPITKKKMSWVINKQTPNRQLWWSSPISGPRRYEWHKYDGDDHDVKSQQWSYTRAGFDRATLLHVLREELLSTTGIDIHNPC